MAIPVAAGIPRTLAKRNVNQPTAPTGFRQLPGAVTWTSASPTPATPSRPTSTTHCRGGRPPRGGPPRAPRPPPAGHSEQSDEHEPLQLLALDPLRPKEAQHQGDR